VCRWDEDERDATDLKLRLRGFTRFFDKRIGTDDPRLRRQLVMLTDKVRTTGICHLCTALCMRHLVKPYALGRGGVSPAFLTSASAPTTQGSDGSL
jgi:hypothetical protein